MLSLLFLNVELSFGIYRPHLGCVQKLNVKNILLSDTIAKKAIASRLEHVFILCIENTSGGVYFFPQASPRAIHIQPLQG